MTNALDEQQLGRLHDALKAHVDRGAMPGLVALVARGNQVHVEVIGAKAFGDREPMPRDAIFRIASLTKPIIAAATMVLVDDGVLRLHDAVDTWLPELADRQVLRSVDAELDETVPAARPITVEDLLTFRLGFGNIMSPDIYPIHAEVEALELKTLGPPWPPSSLTPDEWIARFGTLPLMHQPGEQWMYNAGTQVLGVLIERAARKPLEQFLHERIFEPLQMHATGFRVAPEQLHRFTTQYSPDPETGAPVVLDRADASWWSRPPAFPDGSGWLVSTLDDYWSFVQMLIGHGSHLGVRILATASVELMTTNHLTREQRESNRLFLGGRGWGFGMQAPAAGIDQTGPDGFGWDGGTGTAWRTDPARDLTCILLTQRAMTSPEPPEVFTDFFDGAYAAVVD